MTNGKCIEAETKNECFALMSLAVRKKFVQILLLIFLSQSGLLAQKASADLVILNANIRTIDDKNPQAEAIAIAGNRFVAVGANAEIQAFISEKTKIIDAQKKLIIPGFNDSHVHFLSIGNQFFSINLRDVKTPQEAVEKIKFYVRFLPKGQWILGGAWNHENWSPKKLPTKELIDEVTPEHPVFIYHANPRMVLVNSQALKIAGIDKNTKEIDGGEIVRNEKGEPTGILKDAAISLVKRFTPVMATRNYAAVLETASNYAASLGVTSVQDVHSDDSLEIYRQLARLGKLKTRVYDCVNLFEWKKLAERRIRRATGNALVRYGCLKHFSSGDADEIPELFEAIKAADKADLQVMMHAIGTRPNDIVLTIYERVLRENGTKDRRFRIEHAAYFRPTDLKRFADSQTIASMQPYLFFNQSGEDAELFGKMLNAKVRLAFGSDAAITDFNPLLGIYAAVYHRKSSGKRRISVEEAVRAYTLESAYAEFQENEKGSISVGKLADFIILSHDIFTISPAEILQTNVLMTVMDGKIVYQANNFLK
jgi:predicted amidohydrolase YtcJ